MCLVLKYIQILNNHALVTIYRSVTVCLIQLFFYFICYVSKLIKVDWIICQSSTWECLTHCATVGAPYLFFYLFNARQFYSSVGKLQPRSQGKVRTRGKTRKPWSGPINLAFWLANAILSKNSTTWQLTITIQHIYSIRTYQFNYMYFYDCCVGVYFAK
jgi:hypothetical protein